MDKKQTKNLIVSMSVFFIFIIFTLLLSLVDVKVVTSTDSNIGFFSLNNAVLNLDFPSNKGYDIFCDIVMYICILDILFVGVVFLIQLFKRKSLIKIDKYVFSFILASLMLVAFYLLFDKILVINYRPVLEDGFLVPSYPSTHVLIVTFVLLSTSLYVIKEMNNRTIKIIVVTLSILLILLVTIFRLFVRAHWLTDCIGGIILGTFLTSLIPVFNKFVFNNPSQK